MIDEYKFEKAGGHKNAEYWRCQSIECKAVFHTVGESFKSLKGEHEHNKKRRFKVRNGIQTKA